MAFDLANINTGDCFLRSTDTLMSDAIDWVTDCQWSHSGFFLWNEGTLYVFEFDQSKNNKIPHPQFVEAETYFKEFKQLLILKPIYPFSTEDNLKANRFCHFLTQFRYDYESLTFYQAIKHLSRKIIGKSVWVGKKGIKANKAYSCGEATIDIYFHVKHWFQDIAELGSGSPDDIYKSDIFRHFIIEGDKLKQVDL